MRNYYVYMLFCVDGSYYVGVTNEIDRRLAEHNLGIDPKCFTHSRRPAILVHCSMYTDVLQAIRWEKQLKGWSRAKKRALAAGDWQMVRRIVRSQRERRG